MGARKEALDREHARRHFDAEAKADPHRGCKAEENRLKVALCNAQNWVDALTGVGAELERAHALIARLRAQNAVMRDAIRLATERAKRLDTFPHKYGAKVVLNVLKNNIA